MSFWDETEAKRLFKELSFYNTLVEKTYINSFNKIDVLRVIPFYNELNIVKTSKTFIGYVKGYEIAITDSKDPSVQFTISNPCNADLFKDLLDEMENFKKQITPKVLLSKYKENTDIDLLLFNLILLLGFNGIDHWISEGSG